MEKVYIFGHRNPDTDSVCSAIALSYLKNQLGMNTSPAILSDINNETKYALNYFNVKKPVFLNDVKLKIKDLDYKKGHFINEYESIYSGYLKMEETGTSKIPIVDEDQKFLSVLSMKNIAKDQVEGNIEKLTTTYDNIIKTISGQEVLKFSDKINGDLIIAGYKSSTFIETIILDNSSILIIGDRHSIIEHAITKKVKLIILTGNSSMKEEHYNMAKENGVNIIRTSYSTLQVAKMINLCNYIYKISTTKNILCVNSNMNVSDFIDLANKTKFSYYPVLTDSNKCLGIVRLSDVGEKKQKKVILVDHNTIFQSAEGIEEADIIEVVDHHNIGNIGTSKPINFRNMPLGSTCTICYLMFKENNIEIPYEIAGMLMSGICSDTLVLKSPTSTSIDKEVLTELSKITKIDYNDYGLTMIKKGSSFKGKTKEEILYTDFKNYPFKDSKIGIGQISTTNPEELLNEKEEFIKLIDTIANENDYALITLLVTDILNNGSYILYNNNGESIVKKAFNINNIEQGIFLKDVVSRKLQVIPKILEIDEK
ncbi:MAG: putative manganese-dependent inorganic diphosphatase [Clostridium sp.]|nr:putative manganese-dependent inorganic diphosphatase [Clostridium sp.]MCM1444005.1 putative manganese-dependent inorganic diphosphatase [Candidatus Amulumruptor caecigallinarius]